MIGAEEPLVAVDGCVWHAGLMADCRWAHRTAVLRARPSQGSTALRDTPGRSPAQPRSKVMPGLTDVGEGTRGLRDRLPGREAERSGMGPWVTVTGKRRECDFLIYLYDARAARLILPCACAADTPRGRSGRLRPRKPGSPTRRDDQLTA